MPQKIEKSQTSIKHLQIDKANMQVVIAVSVAVAIVVFSAVATTYLFKKMSYQNKVISLRSKANKQLEANITATKELVQAYNGFDGASESVIGNSDKNSTVILNALPSKYDFPALATSLEALIANSGSKITSITGTDDAANAEQNSLAPKPIEIPFEISASGNFASSQKLVTDLERSIRPFQILGLVLAGKDSELTTTIKAKTYYQPETKLGIKDEIVPNGSGTAVPKPSTISGGSSTNNTSGATK
jgi:hypothetical protein